MPPPTVESPPLGLDAYWLGAWRAALKQLKEQGSWVPAHKPLLDEYVRALQLADKAFRSDAGGDRHSKRALAYAVELELTPRVQKARKKSKEADAKPQDRFAELDELAPRRKAPKAP